MVEVVWYNDDDVEWDVKWVRWVIGSVREAQDSKGGRVVDFET